MMKKLSHIVLITALGVVLLAGLVAGFTQTQFFRDRLREAALATLDSVFSADLHLGTIRGNLVTGFSIDSIAVVLEGRDVLTARRATVGYSLPGLLAGRFPLDRLILIGPLIRMERRPGAPWNLSAILRSQQPDTSEDSAPLSLPDLEIGLLEIHDGTIVLFDSAALTDPGHGPREPAALEYHDVTLTDVQLSLSASMGGRKAGLSVHDFACLFVSPQFRLLRLRGEFAISPDGMSVKNLEIRTERSSVVLSASVEDLDMLDGLSLEALSDRPVSLQLSAHDVDFADMNFFLPALSFLQGPVALDVEAEGPYADLAVRQLSIGFGTSRLDFNGRVANLDDPGNLFLDVATTGAVIRDRDPAGLMPEFGLEPLAVLGETSMDLAFRGTPLDFAARFALRSEAGRLRSDSLHLSIGGPSVLRYAGDVAVENLDLARVSEDPALGSRLTGRARIEGEGVSLERLRGSLRVQFDRSEFRGLRVGPSRLVVEAFGQRLGAFAGVSLDDMQVMLSGELDIREHVPPFTINGNITSVNLAPLVGDPRYDTDITATLNVHGRGLSAQTVSLDAMLDLTSTRYGKYTLDSGAVRCRLEQLHDGDRRLSVESRLADFLVEGKFDLEYISAILAHRVAVIGDAAERRIDAWTRRGESPLRSTNLEQMERELELARSQVDARYSLTIKDLEPVSVVAGERAFNGRGTLTGSIRGDHHDLSVSAELSASEFFYGNVESGILLQDASALLIVDHLTLADPLGSSRVRMETSAARVHLNDSALDSVRVAVVLDSSALTFEVAGMLNEGLLGAIAGRGVLTSDTVEVVLTDLKLGLPDFLWSADPGAHLLMAGGSAAVRSLVLRRDTQEVAIHAGLTAGGVLTVGIRAEQISIDNLEHLVAEQELGPSDMAFGGSLQLVLEAGGTLEQPWYSGTVAGRGLSFRGVPIGNLSADLTYRDSLLDVRAHIEDPAGSGPGGPILSATGIIPVNLALAAVRHRVDDRPVDMTILSGGLPLGVLDPLLPTFNELSGLVLCDMHLGGSLREPEYTGTLRIPQSSFLFVPNNITYSLTGTFAADGERISIVEAVVSNVPGDEQSGRLGTVAVTGDFRFQDFAPGDFRLQGEGALLVVKEATRTSDLSVYGNLFVEIAEGGLLFTGEIRSSLLKGDLLVRNSELVFPPTQRAALERLQITVPVTVVDDTTQLSDRQSRTAEARYFSRRPGGAGQARQELSGVSFMDGLRYDLDIEMSGSNTQIRMIFDPLSGEELEAAINGRFSITGDGTRWFGDLSIDRAYYNFLKRFNAEGTLRYRGDFADPELVIRAQYEGTRVVQDSVDQREEKVVVTFVIGGTRMKPSMDYEMTVDGVEYAQYRGPKSNDLQSDAIQFVVYGSFPLSAAERGDVPNDVRDKLGLSVLTGATSLLTGALSEFLRNQTGFINSVELSYTGRTIGTSPDIRLSGTAWNGYWRYGGRLFDDPLNTANFSLIYSFDAIFDAPSLRNLMVELERRVETNPLGQKNDLKRVNSARLYYRFSF